MRGCGGGWWLQSWWSAASLLTMKTKGMRHLGGWVSSASDSGFQPRTWSQALWNRALKDPGIFPTILALKFSSWVFTHQWSREHSIMQIGAYCYPRGLNISCSTQCKQSHCLKEKYPPLWELSPWDSQPKPTSSPKVSAKTSNASFRDFMRDIFSSHWSPIETIHRAPLSLSFRCSWKHFCWALRGKKYQRRLWKDMKFEICLSFMGIPKHCQKRSEFWIYSWGVGAISGRSHWGKLFMHWGTWGRRSRSYSRSL